MLGLREGTLREQTLRLRGCLKRGANPALDSSEKSRKQDTSREELLRNLMESCNRNNIR